MCTTVPYHLLHALLPPAARTTAYLLHMRTAAYYNTAHAHYSATLRMRAELQVRTAFGVALALNRTLVLPRLLCGLETVTNFPHRGAHIGYMHMHTYICIYAYAWHGSGRDLARCSHCGCNVYGCSYYGYGYAYGTGSNLSTYPLYTTRMHPLYSAVHPCTCTQLLDRSCTYAHAHAHAH